MTVAPRVSASLSRKDWTAIIAVVISALGLMYLISKDLGMKYAADQETRDRAHNEMLKSMQAKDHEHDLAIQQLVIEARQRDKLLSEFLSIAKSVGERTQSIEITLTEIRAEIAKRNKS